MDDFNTTTLEEELNTMKSQIVLCLSAIATLGTALVDNQIVTPEMIRGAQEKIQHLAKEGNGGT